MQIPVFESLVGGIAVKTSPNSKEDEATAERMLEKLAELVGQANVLMTLQKLAEKGLDLLHQHQDQFTDAWLPLFTPLQSAATGTFAESKEVIHFLQVAMEAYQKLVKAQICVDV